MNHPEAIKELFVRDLEKLIKEVESYDDESLLWIKKAQINNSAGNLTLHLCGNLKHFIGAILSKNGYVRDREFEFYGKADRRSLVEGIKETISVIETYFGSANFNDFSKSYPLEVFGYPMTVFYFIIHLQGHLNYHLGQVNYHRRLIGNFG